MGIPAQTDPASAPFSITQLAPGIGAEIHGIDCASPLPDGAFETIRNAWHDNCVILLRHQDLTERQQAAFAKLFGGLGEITFSHDGGNEEPGVIYVSNIRENGELIGALPDGEMWFHSDKCYRPDPAIATMLYGMELPSHGGNTLFANMFEAYASLPDDVKQRLEGRLAMNVYDFYGHPTERGSKISDDVLHHAHPAVRTHPGNGRKALYVNRLMTDHIVDMDPAESEELLEFLFDHSERAEFVYEHVWSPGDLVMWDNRSCLHARSDFDASERRLLRRVVVQGEYGNTGG